MGRDGEGVKGERHGLVVGVAAAAVACMGIGEGMGRLGGVKGG